MKLDKIFIQIAAYRDNQLLSTIKDCIDKATCPENLVFCIAWQHSLDDEWDTLAEYADDDRFKIIDIDYKASKGACWARNQIQQKYDNEEYTMQLDSHHRFVQNWDGELIGMIKYLQIKGHAKPLLTTYLPSFNPENDPKDRVMLPWKMNFDRFIPEGVVFFLPAAIGDHKILDAPIPSRFYSGHFCFTLGIFCQEVQHDPELYFHGEEISIAVRAFTWGYDLFHPHRLIAWHEYTRKYRKKHWDDHKGWGTSNNIAHVRVRKLFGIDGIVNDIDFGKYGFGQVRRLSDYEKYAGICFKNRSVQNYTLAHKSPPNPVIDDENEYQQSFSSIFKHCINIHKSSIHFDEYKFWAIIFEDKDGCSIFREDMTYNQVKATKDESDGFYKIWKTFDCVKKPHKSIVWPFSEQHGWCVKIETIL